MKNISLKIIYVVAALAVSACKKTDPTPTDTDNSLKGDAAINNWIYDSMKSEYYWADKMPTKDPISLNQDPESYFDKLLFEKGNTDRFSWIEKSSEELKNSFQGITKSYGFKFSAFTVQNSERVILAVRYAVKGGPAETAGIKRGDIISKINGQVLTPANWVSLAYPDEPSQASFGYATYANSKVTDLTQAVSVTATQVTEDPVFLSKVITKGNKKIGYFVYNQFINTADSKVRNVMMDFKNQGINELILDFRYNPGGYVSSAVVIGSLVGKNVKTTDNFAVYEYNANVMERERKKSGANFNLLKFRNESNNVGANLNRVFVLTSRSTASASELIINGLKPFMEVVIVGDNTYGKNVGSYTIEDTQNPKRWNWGLQPITFKTFNANNESNYGTASGFTPNHVSKDNVLPFKQLGDETETMLAKTLQIITGVTVAQARRGETSTLVPLVEPEHKNSIGFNMIQ